MSSHHAWQWGPAWLPRTATAPGCACSLSPMARAPAPNVPVASKCPKPDTAVHVGSSECQVVVTNCFLILLAMPLCTARVPLASLAAGACSWHLLGLCPPDPAGPFQQSSSQPGCAEGHGHQDFTFVCLQLCEDPAPGSGRALSKSLLLVQHSYFWIPAEQVHFHLLVRPTDAFELGDHPSWGKAFIK